MRECTNNIVIKERNGKVIIYNKATVNDIIGRISSAVYNYNKGSENKKDLHGNLIDYSDYYKATFDDIHALAKDSNGFEAEWIGNKIKAIKESIGMKDLLFGDGERKAKFSEIELYKMASLSWCFYSLDKKEWELMREFVQFKHEQILDKLNPFSKLQNQMVFKKEGQDLFNAVAENVQIVLIKKQWERVQQVITLECFYDSIGADNARARMEDIVKAFNSYSIDAETMKLTTKIIRQMIVGDIKEVRQAEWEKIVAKYANAMGKTLQEFNMAYPRHADMNGIYDKLMEQLKPINDFLNDFSKNKQHLCKNQMLSLFKDDVISIDESNKIVIDAHALESKLKERFRYTEYELKDDISDVRLKNLVCEINKDIKPFTVGDIWETIEPIRYGASYIRRLENDCF